MTENPRVEELRRRVQKDPASIAFAQLAEEHRRGGEYDEAIRICRAGLEQHPGYLSARVTLGRALLETGQFDEAQGELEYVLRAAPDNLAAIRALAEIHQRREDPSYAAPPPISAESKKEETPLDIDETQFGTALDLAFLGDLGAGTRNQALEPPSLPPDPMLAELESWLGAILRDREARLRANGVTRASASAPTRFGGQVGGAGLE